MTDAAPFVSGEPVCPVSHSLENGTAGQGSAEAGHGTPDAPTRVSLKILARQALSDVVPHGTAGGTGAGQLVPKVRDNADGASSLLLADGMCPHIEEKARRHPANIGRVVRCAACFLAAHPNWKPRRGWFVGSIAQLKEHHRRTTHALSGLDGDAHNRDGRQ